MKNEQIDEIVLVFLNMFNAHKINQLDALGVCTTMVLSILNSLNANERVMEEYLESVRKCYLHHLKECNQ